MASGEAIFPYCSSERVLPEFNSLADLFPDIAKLWSDDNVSEANKSFPNSITSVKWNFHNCGGKFHALIKIWSLTMPLAPSVNTGRSFPDITLLLQNTPNS